MSNVTLFKLSGSDVCMSRTSGRAVRFNVCVFHAVLGASYVRSIAHYRRSDKFPKLLTIDDVVILLFHSLIEMCLLTISE